MQDLSRKRRSTCFRGTGSGKDRALTPGTEQKKTPCVGRSHGACASEGNARRKGGTARGIGARRYERTKHLGFIIAERISCRKPARGMKCCTKAFGIFVQSARVRIPEKGIYNHIKMVYNLSR